MADKKQPTQVHLRHRVDPVEAAKSKSATIPQSADKTQPRHIRLPQRADAVEGPETVPGKTTKQPDNLDPRTVSQDPITQKGTP